MFVSAANAHVLQTPLTTPMTAEYTVACQSIDADKHMCISGDIAKRAQGCCTSLQSCAAERTARQARGGDSPRMRCSNGPAVDVVWNYVAVAGVWRAALANAAVSGARRRPVSAPVR
jgi:hypothetical protein